VQTLEGCKAYELIDLLGLSLLSTLADLCKLEGYEVCGKNAACLLAGCAVAAAALGPLGPVARAP
jgi:hypothetical protein